MVIDKREKKQEKKLENECYPDKAFQNLLWKNVSHFDLDSYVG